MFDQVKCPYPNCDVMIEIPKEPPPIPGLRGLCPVQLHEYRIASVNPLALEPIASDD